MKYPKCKEDKLTQEEQAAQELLVKFNENLERSGAKLPDLSTVKIEYGSKEHKAILQEVLKAMKKGE